MVTRAVGYGFPTYHMVVEPLEAYMQLEVLLPSGAVDEPEPRLEVRERLDLNVDYVREVLAERMLERICEHGGYKIGDFNLNRMEDYGRAFGDMRRRISNLTKQVDVMVASRRRNAATLEEMRQQRDVAERDLSRIDKENNELRARVSQLEHELDIIRYGLMLFAVQKSLLHNVLPVSCGFDDPAYVVYGRYRIQSDKKVAICSVHPSEQATLQCLGCIKAKVPVAKRYHCSPKCFSDAWQYHHTLHDRPASAANEEEEMFGRFNSGSSISYSLSGSASGTSLTNGSTALYPSAVPQKNGSETWFEVGHSKTYTPSADDIGHVLKFECVVVDVETKLPVGYVNTILISRVIPAPSPSPRHLILVSGVDVLGHLDSDGRISSLETFTVLSYNILSDAYAISEAYSYCPSWALSWPYRRQNLLREIVGYRVDIVCLQEVQSDHFDEFFSPELEKHGYQALYKRKTNEVEFNKAAQSLTEALVPSSQKKTALNRSVKDNVALIVVLEAKFSNQGPDNPGKRQLLCVANTHVNVHHELKDVHTLLKGLEKIAASADIPMLVCGDFNSVPGSAPHALLAMGKVDPLHPDLVVDPLADSLTVESLLELLDEDNLRKDTVLPSPESSSDHIALLAEFRCKPRPRR
ncbi:DNase I-like superfamily protein isoform 1 [Tripterygium wilfordii]|uniref:DNase I-like superfamily protein isoform 1 n=1 Tax=Tripterygium wilfordii TaxID=458696 RepID=A0A7J7DWS1_TRIWF|nr:DNase I-like superfamily protein isoform 1 [Tripterygium wilfordii]